MNVNINGIRREYNSDFDPINIDNSIKRNWKVSAGPYFKFPIVIGDVSCFVKRFQGEASQISGYSLLQAIKNLSLQGLPKIYDIVETKENGKKVIYLFTEFIPGNTLDELQRKGFNFIPSKLVGDLFSSLSSIQKYGYWFPDFDPKNLLLSEKGNYYLIDLDSSYPLKTLPQKSIFGSKDYWGPIYAYYKEYEKFKPNEVTAIRGDVLNSLNLLYLISLYSSFIYGPAEDLTAFSIVHLNKYLTKLHPSFRSVLKSCFQKQPGTDKFIQRPLSLSILNNLVNHFLFKDDNLHYLSSNPINPEITYFRINGSATDNFYFTAGQQIELEWMTKNATEIKILKYHYNLAAKGRLTFSPVVDTQYTLQAVHFHKRGNLKIERTIKLFINPLKPSYSLELKREDNLIGNHFMEGQTYSLSWLTFDATEVYINGSKVQNSGEINLVAQKSTTHAIKVINKKGNRFEIAEGNLTVVTHPLPYIKAFSASPTFIYSGKNVSIKWDAVNGKGIAILKNGIPIETNCALSGSRLLKLESETNSIIEKVIFQIEAKALIGDHLTKSAEIIVRIFSFPTVNIFRKSSFSLTNKLEIKKLYVAVTFLLTIIGTSLLFYLKWTQDIENDSTIAPNIINPITKDPEIKIIKQQTNSSPKQLEIKTNNHEDKKHIKRIKEPVALVTPPNAKFDKFHKLHNDEAKLTCFFKDLFAEYNDPDFTNSDFLVIIKEVANLLIDKFPSLSSPDGGTAYTLTCTYKDPFLKAVKKYIPNIDYDNLAKSFKSCP